MVEFKLKELQLQGQLEEVGSSGPDMNMFIAFSPANNKSKEYAKVLSDGMEKIRKNGELKKILDKYGLKDWK